MRNPGRRRRRHADASWPVAAVQLVGLPLVVLGDLGWTAAIGIYSLEAALVALAHLLPRRGRPRPDRGGLVSALALALPTTVLGVASLGSLAPDGWAEPVAAALGLVVIVGGIGATALRSGRTAAIGTPADATVRLGLVWAAWVVTGLGEALTGTAPGTAATVCLVLVVAGFELLAARGDGSGVPAGRAT